MLLSHEVTCIEHNDIFYYKLSFVSFFVAEGEELENPDKINPFVGKNIEVINDSVDNKALNLRQDDRHLQHEDYYEYEGEADVSISASGATLPLQKRLVFLCLMFLSVLGHIS